MNRCDYGAAEDGDKERTEAAVSGRYRCFDASGKVEFWMSSSSSRAFTASTLCGSCGATRKSLQVGERGPWVYDEAERNALILQWEASDRACGKRLKALLPVLVEVMERHGHFDLGPEFRGKLLPMCAATIDRTLGPTREGLGRPGGGLTAHACGGAFPL